MLNDIESVLIDEETLKEKVFELGAAISRDYKGRELFIITVLKGGFIFAADLMRRISIPAEIDFMAVSSYGNKSKASGVVRILKDLDKSIEGKSVLIIEDILDSGMTLSHLKTLLMSRNPESLKICALLDKPSRRQAQISVDYKGFEIPDEFVVGYGLDFNERYRNIPFIGVLKREIYE